MIKGYKVPNKKISAEKVILLFAVFLLVFLMSFMIINDSIASAGSLPLVELSATVSPTSTPLPTATPQPVLTRQIVEKRTFVYYHWALYWWENGKLACNIFQEETEQPSQEKIQFSCGSKIAQAWQSTPLCENLSSSESCEGLYLKDMGEIVTEVQEYVEIALPSVEVGLVNCSAWGDCNANPKLSFFGFEPIEGEYITAIYVKIGSKSYICSVSPCIIEMPMTGVYGEEVEYWADSSFGDNSIHYYFSMRNIKIQKERYSFQLLGEKWEEETPPCALIWNMFPEYLDAGPLWLSSEDSATSLATDHAYSLLGGYLITRGHVDSSACSDNGLLLNWAASTCGMEVAESALLEWQNQYDELIFSSAQDSNLPGHLLKGLVAQESQFFATRSADDEYGLGMLTDEGMDLLMTWNTEYFVEQCTLVYGKKACEAGYSRLTEDEMAMLRGLAFKDIGTDQEIPLIAKTLSAACGQTGQLVRNITGNEPHKVITYTDIWKLTLGIYNAGAGCLMEAIDIAWTKDAYLKWGNISDQLIPGCELARDYVDKVIFYGLP